MRPVLEDLQMILSLADDADEEYMEDVMLEEAEPFEVMEVTSVLQRLSSSCEERESNFACKTRTEGGGNVSKALNAIPGIVTELRKNAKIPEKSGAITCKFKGRQCKPSILHFLTGKKFVRILKSLDIPCFSGMGKGKQINTLEKNLRNVKVVNIKYPKKVCTIFFISQ